jgi:hypothetical protein
MSLFNRAEGMTHKFKVYKAIMLPFVVYGCEILCLRFREEHRQRMPENRMCRAKRKKVTGKWRRLKNNEPYILYFSPNITRIIK